MNVYPQYFGSLTREQFLYYEVRVVAKLLCSGYSDEEIVSLVVSDNLFQLPTEKSVKSLCKSCLKRLRAVGTPTLNEIIANGNSESSKQASLYLLMRYNKIVCDFMVNVIGEKYRTLDFDFDKYEVEVFLNNLKLENENVASWSDLTINKIRSVLVKCLSDTGFLNNIRSTKLNIVYLNEEVLECIKENNDFDALKAFNYLN